MTYRELLQEALESIEWLRLHLERDHACLHMKPAVSGIPDWLNKTEAALRARLSQPDVTETNFGKMPETINMENFVGSGKPLVPVCWMNANDIDKTDWKVWAHGKPTVSMPLFTVPPKREWVGLTKEEVREGNRESWVTIQAWESAVWWAEAKLKEKNT